MFAMLRPEFAGVNAGGGNRTRVRGKGNSFEAELRVPVWINQVFATEWFDQGPNPVNVTVSGSGDNLQATVQNTLSTDLGPLFLVAQDTVYSIPKLKAGEIRTFGREARVSSLSSFVQTHGNTFMSVINERRSAFGSDRATRGMDVHAGVVAASFVSLANQSYLAASAKFDLSHLVQSKRAILFAWAPDHSPMQPLNQFLAPRSTRHTVYRIAIRPEE